jgi:two-component system response regulator RstA
MTTESGPRVLIVEDDPKLAGLVADYLAANGLSVTIESRGDRAEARILAERPDAVVLDLMLPGRDGLAVCRAVRPRYDGAILMLTARGGELDEVVGLEVGADDYLAKPVRPRVLLARLHTLLRRTRRAAGGAEPAGGGAPEVDVKRIELGSLVVDAARRRVEVAGAPVELTTAEFDLLWLLARHAGEIMDRERIYTELRGIIYDGIDRSMDLRVARLRRKLGDDGKQPERIKSIRGTGYLLVVDP